MDREQTLVREPEIDRPLRKPRWSELSPGQRRAIVLGAMVELIMTTIALRDLVRRPAAQVRGPKAVWVLACFVQPVGPLSYFLVGRRSTRATRPYVPYNTCG